ncbi:CBS domain-containing protein [Marinoscillum furvescens]|uniref:CBS domain protein n=1 Tax=Marinoscillum furvescens DSM 4134 TaxID=1122208 RepID=A0A3D9L7P0_MARFU|nr:CBS domain-containing protein [Marinoscillum furvescens]REE01679.1 CBS domain protein [Marinoscillum furvescens DSM 4134]
MIAKDLINYMIPPLKPQDKVSKAKQWMDELRLSELPVVDNGVFVGLIDEELLLNDELKYPNIGDYPLLGQKCTVGAGNHYYDVLKTSNIEGFRIVAVIDELNQYLGVVSIEDVVEAFAKNSSVSTPGAILGLRLKFNDYSLTEISRIIESNEVKILSSYLSPHSEDPNDLHLTLKLNKEDISHIISQLEEAGFTVESAHNTASSSFDEKERIDILMKYLKI